MEIQYPLLYVSMRQVKLFWQNMQSMGYNCTFLFGLFATHCFINSKVHTSIPDSVRIKKNLLCNYKQCDTICQLLAPYICERMWHHMQFIFFPRTRTRTRQKYGCTMNKNFFIGLVLFFLTARISKGVQGIALQCATLSAVCSN